LKATKIASSVYFLEGDRGGRYPLSNSLLVGRESFLLIDTGFTLSPDGVEELKKNFPVEIVVNTHCHEDHILRNHFFKESQVCCHFLDAPAVESIEELNKRYISPEDKHLFMMGEAFLRDFLDVKGSKVDLEFGDGYTFNLEGTKLVAIHTPGHSIGHCCFYIPNEKILFLSDIDLTSFGPWYGGLDSNLKDFISSIGKVKELKAEVALTSHKAEVIRGQDEIIKRINEYESKIWERERKILKLLEGKWLTLDEIVDHALIYGKFPEPREFFRLSEKLMVEKHLKKLVEEGIVEERDGKFKAR